MGVGFLLGGTVDGSILAHPLHRGTYSLFGPHESTVSGRLDQDEHTHETSATW